MVAFVAGVLASLPATTVGAEYTPRLHGDGMALAFKRVFERSAALQELVARAPAARKDTHGSCKVWRCATSRGATDCIATNCFCRYGYVQWRGACLETRQGEPKPCGSKEEFMRYLIAGVREPDDMSVPGGDREMAEQIVEATTGIRVYNVSLARAAVQVYHASPLPLVRLDELLDAPKENGYVGSENLRRNLFSVLTLRQWRTVLVKAIARQAFLAVTAKDAVEGIRRLGNGLHALTDSFSRSHVIRRGSRERHASPEVCDALTVLLPISMDVVSWVRHIPADSRRDLRWHCGNLYASEGIRHWAEARGAGSGLTNVTDVNAFLARLASVLCRALPVEESSLDRPAGGASSYFSSDSHRPIMPRGVASDADSWRIVRGWSEALAASRRGLKREDKRRTPLGFRYSPRHEDACKTPSLIHVTAEDVRRAQASAPDLFLLPPDLPTASFGAV